MISGRGLLNECALHCLENGSTDRRTWLMVKIDGCAETGLDAVL